MSADAALALISSSSRVFVHGAAATPQHLLEALTRRAGELEQVETVHLHLEGSAPHARREYASSFRPNALFCGANMREAVAEGRADYTPVFLSEIPRLFREAILPLDAALLHVSPPDRHGQVSLGVSVDIALAAAQSAKIRVAQVNRQMPRTLGDASLPLEHFQALVEVDEPLPEHPQGGAGAVEKAIAQHVAGLVDEGATLQMGIGAIPDAVLKALVDHRRLGVHTEMFSDGLLPLIKRGVITNEHKPRGRGRSVSSFAVGSRALYDFLHDNALIEMRESSYVNDSAIIRQMPKMTSINSALEIDLSGQVVADSIGERIYSGVGGQMDFVRGATLAQGGKAIIALPSQTQKGISRIVARLKPGAGVVTTRAHIRFVVTEYGVADLYAKSLRARAQALIAIAHPDHREALESAARERFGRL